MDLMQIRRLLLEMTGGGSVGADYAKGTFTIPANQGSTYKLEFGKTFSKYLFFVEMTDGSKNDLLDTTLEGRRAIAFIGKYPRTSINNTTNNNFFCYTYIPSTGGTNTTTTSLTIDDTSITFGCVTINTNNQFSLIKGLSYNYYVVEIQ